MIKIQLNFHNLFYITYWLHKCEALVLNKGKLTRCVHTSLGQVRALRPKTIQQQTAFRCTEKLPSNAN